MNIEYGAFQNCVSLKQIIFDCVNEPVFTGITEDCNLPESYAIVVPDNIKDKQIEIELRNNKLHVKSFADIEKDKIQQQIEDYDVVAAIVCLKKCRAFDVQDTIDALVDKYLVVSADIKVVDDFFSKYNFL